MSHKGKLPKNYNPPNRPPFFSMGDTKNKEFWDNLKKGAEERIKQEENDARDKRSD